MSLRARFVALVVGAVLLTLVALALPGRRIALEEFEASIHAIVREARVEGPRGPEAPLRPASLDDLADEVRTAGPAERAIWIGEDGGVRAASDPEWEARPPEIAADGSILLERVTPTGLERLRLAGGRTVRAPDGSPAGRLFRFPSDDLLLADRGDAFSRALDRRLLLWAGLVVAGGAGLAVLLVGHALTPLQRLGAAARRIADGDLGARAGPGGPPEIRAVADAFDDMARHLEASEEVRRRMIRDVAHDLRTPLTNLRGQIEAMQDGLRPVDGAALASLHEEAALLQRLVTDVEALARADEGRLDLHPETLPLATLVETVLDGFVQSERLARDALRVEIPEALAVRADRAALGRALRNVVDNAVVHAPGAPVEVTARGVGDRAVLSVRDRGPGIPPEHLPRVTERLYRVDPARGRGAGGSGLGLSIADELLTASGGALRVASPAGGGVAVELWIPRG